MRIIGFSSAAAPSSFWTLPVQALGPWMNRVKRSVGHMVKQPAQGHSDAQVHALPFVSRAASNEAVFAMPEVRTRLENTTLKAASLRIVRESDPAIGAECAGRMMISGRMADVCAELDRMALRADAAQAAGVSTRP